jgi:hypothetical protein
MPANNYENKYCPVCLSPVDDQGSHWTPCEYEAWINDWVNPEQPLTESEMLEKAIINAESEIIRYLLHIKGIEEKIIEFEERLKKIIF